MNRLSDLAVEILHWLPAVLIMALIFFVSGTPSTKLPNFGKMEPFVEIGGHILSYGLLAQSYLLGIGKRDCKSQAKAGLLAMLYGISDELHQSFIPGREASYIDLGIDLLGILVGLTIITIYKHLKT